MVLSTVTGAAALTIVIITIWLYRINSAMKSVPEEVAEWAPRRWTQHEVRAAYERIKRNPVDFVKDLPPRLDRRYIVIGGAGMVGGDIVMALLQRGQSRDSIRIVDFAPVTRPDLVAGNCGFVKADITLPASVEAAFSEPWPASVSKSPLTVFHTAALINPGERHPMLYERARRVNAGGTANLLGAAKKAGADIFISTGSTSIDILPAEYIIWPWQNKPRRWIQTASEKDFDAPIRPHNQYFANYARSKAEAERLVCLANEETFRTGSVRPGNGIYGQNSGQLIGLALRMGTGIVTSTPHLIQQVVHSRNVALAHLLFESALTRKEMPLCAGRPFAVTDPGPMQANEDLYTAITTLATTPTKVTILQPIVFFILGHLVEAYILALARLPFLKTVLGLKDPGFPLNLLQPSILAISMHMKIDDSAARRSVEDGGISYHGSVNSLDGICQEILEWNLMHEASKGTR
ncbi:dehydrogenase-like protein [Lasiosphaeris hirsuta]|uniref:Dehydrogenase-like protein n=1 Tax=Lasiosphaeris hirsuta TaxID=260670 RepID=A0AA40BBZ3_9PEZI|nr:dehydrogenase-like protein [Lasiosphaeris hirsuta]